MNRTYSPARHNRGFTLLEVLVAFSILALSLGVLMALFSKGLRNTVIAHEYSMAITMAESKLASVGVAEPLRPGENEGSFDDHYRWHTKIIPQVSDLKSANEEYAGQLYRVSVQVMWDSLNGERSVTLTTLRMITIY